MKVTGLVIGCALMAALIYSPTRAFAADPPAWKMGDPVITYWAGPMPMTDAAARQIAQGGFNLAWVTEVGLPAGQGVGEHFRNQLDILQKHGLRGILPIGGVNREPNAPSLLDNPQWKARLDAILKSVIGHPALYAYHIQDEPGAAEFSQIARIKTYLHEKDPSTLVYVNLLPIYATNEQLGAKGDPATAYQSHLKQFVRDVKPQLLSYDFYPFDVGVKGDRGDYFLNLSLVRQAALDANIPFMVIQQAAVWMKDQRLPTGEMLRWQACTALAYGSRGLSWYVYSYPGHDGGMSFSAGTYRESAIAKEKGEGVVLCGEPTPLYYYAAAFHKEYASLARELQPLHSLAVYHAGMLPEGAAPLPNDAPFHIEPPVPQKNGAPPAPVEGFVIGYFGEEKTPTHALVVNLDYRTYSAAGEPRSEEFLNPIRRRLLGPGRLQIFDPQTSRWTDAAKEGVDLRLPPGDCVLVRTAR